MSIAQLIRQFRDLDFSSPPSGTLIQKLLGLAPATGLGYSIDVYGNTLVVGNYLDSPIGSQSGSVYVYVLENSVWALQQVLSAPDGAANDNFGVSVSITQDTIAVGSYRDDTTSGTDSGSVYVYTRSSTTWDLQQKLLPDSGSDWLGFCVDMGPDIIVVGAPRDNAGATQNGSVYVYTRTGTTWNLQQKIVPTIGTGDQAGTSIALDGNLLAIGIPGNDVFSTDFGAVHTYVFSGGSWQFQQAIVPSYSAGTRRYGDCVALDGTTLAVGAGSTTASVDVFVYVFDGSNWTQQAQFPRQGIATSYFGRTMSLKGDLLAIGARSETVSSITFCGVFFLYKRVGTTWSNFTKFIPTEITASALFGAGIHVTDTHIFSGASGDDSGGTNAGAVYVYSIS